MAQTFTVQQLKNATGNFDKVNYIGSGAFGNVYKGNIEEKQIAIKISMDRSHTRISQWTNEISTLGELHHDHIIQLLGHLDDGKSLYLVYDLMAKCLNSEIRGLNWGDTLKVLRETATALSHIHGKEYVFGDLKPQNILLDKENNVKLCDFGIVRKESNKKRVDLQTPGYVAPEAKATGGNRQSDIYSFGILILQLISKWEKVEKQEETPKKQRRGKEKANEGKDLRSWADREEIVKGHAVNKDLYRTSGPEKAALITKLGLQCSNHHENARPSITAVIEKLNEL